MHNIPYNKNKQKNYFTNTYILYNKKKTKKKL